MKMLYQTENERTKKLKNILVNFDEYMFFQRKLSKVIDRVVWRIRVKQYDKALKNLTNTLDLGKINA